MANIKNSVTFIKIFGDLFHDAGSISDYLIQMAGWLVNCIWGFGSGEGLIWNTVLVFGVTVEDHATPTRPR